MRGTPQASQFALVGWSEGPGLDPHSARPADPSPAAGCSQQDTGETRGWDFRDDDSYDNPIGKPVWPENLPVAAESASAPY